MLSKILPVTLPAHTTSIKLYENQAQLTKNTASIALSGIKFEKSNEEFQFLKSQIRG